MDKEHLQTKVHPSVADRVETYGDEQELSSEYQTVNELIRRGLEAEGYGAAADGGRQRLSLAQRTLTETSKALFFMGAAWLLVSAYTTADMALPAVTAGALGLVCFSLEPRLEDIGARLGVVG